MNTKETTVIVRTMNSSDIIAQTLKALFSQTYKDFELLVVDSGSSDDTLEQISYYEHRLIQIKPQDYHPGIVLNNAVESSNSKLIVFLNSDTVMLHKDCLELLINELKQNDTHAVFARQVARPEAKPWVKRDYEIAFPKNADAPSWMYYSLPLSGIKKEIWEQNPFYTKAWASEDTKMGFDLKSKGLNVKYLSNVLVMHSHNYTLKQIFNRRFVEGEADVFIFSNKFNGFNFFKQYVKSVLNDLFFHIKSFEFKELSLCFVRRFIYQYAYYKGHKNGQKRKKLHLDDATYGNYQ